MAGSGIERHSRRDIAGLEGLSPSDVAELRAAGLHTLTELLERIATEGFDATVPGDPECRRNVRRALASYALREADGQEDSIHTRSLAFLTHHWLDLLLLLLLSVGLVGVVRATWYPEAQVITTRDLVPFQVVDSADVEVRRSAAGFGTLGTSDQAIGRLTLEPITAGAPLRGEQLSRLRLPDPAYLNDRHIVSLPIPTHAAPLAPTGSRISLLLAPVVSPADAGGAALVIEDALVLDNRGDGDSIALVLAIRKPAPAALARVGADYRVAILQDVDSPRPDPSLTR